MIAFLGTLLLVHCGYTFVTVKPVLPGEPVTFNCVLPNADIAKRDVRWYKQSPGDTLRQIVKLTMRHQQPTTSELAPEFCDSRWLIDNNETFSSLKILSATQEDEGTYHCAIMDWSGTNIWTGTYLFVKGNTARASNYTVFQQPDVSDAGSSAGVGTLQCSVLSGSENKTCSGDPSVFWLRAEAEESHPNIIYIDKNKPGECTRISGTQRSCFYHFSKNVVSSDSANYYCAVATCGKILFENATKEQTGGFQFTVLTLVACLVISMIVNGFICFQSIRTSCKFVKAEREIDTSQEMNNFSPQLNQTAQDVSSVSYAAINFSGRNVKQERRKKRTKTEEVFYSEVQCKPNSSV